MKVGAGGLISLAFEGVVPLRKIDPLIMVRREGFFLQGPPPKKTQIEELVGAVDKLNRAAKMFNQPVEFLPYQREDGTPSIQIRDQKSKEIIVEIPAAFPVQAVREPLGVAGLLLDWYL